MTLGEGKRKVYMLLDEYSSGGEITQDADIENKMADFFDMAQKDLSRVCRITHTHTIERAEGQTEYDMPADFVQLKNVWRDGKIYRGYQWKAGKIVIPLQETATVELEYYAIPETVNGDTEDEFEFEIPDDAAQAMCYYVAAQQLLVDLVMDYSAPWAIWLQMKQELSQRAYGVPPRGIVNTLYR